MNDIPWLTEVELKIVPDPRLPDPQKTAIELDYGMKDGILRVKTRVALAFYLIKRLNLDLDLVPERKQIVLSNFDQIKQLQQAAYEKMKARVRNRG